MNSLFPLQAAILQADARAIPLRDQSVHCVVTSPPYWGLRDYGEAGQLGLEATPEEYLENMAAVFAEVARVLRDDGTAWVNMGDCYASSGTRKHADLKPKDLVGMPWRLAFALQAAGWYLRSDIIWAKPNPLPESVTDRPTKAHEYVFLLSKRARYYYDADAVRESAICGNHHRTIFDNGPRDVPPGDPPHSGIRRCPGPEAGRNLRDVWHITTQPYQEAHFATYPEKLVEPCIKAGTSQKGVCSKCGAGWVRVVEKTQYTPEVVPVGVRNVDMSRGDKTRKLSGKEYNEQAKTTTTGWKPACACDAPTEPAIIFDPFGGSGTTAAVALKLGRRAVILDIGYHDLAKKRIYG